MNNEPFLYLQIICKKNPIRIESIVLLFCFQMFNNRREKNELKFYNNNYSIARKIKCVLNC